MLEINHEAGEALIGQMFSTRVTYVNRDTVQLTPLPDDRIEWLKNRVETASEDDATVMIYGNSIGWAQIYGAELRID